ncbi:ABC transporter permease [Rhodococcus sp. MTM3W5.2]|uniref:ABC transporter permease n=1 Tax=Rhodococcus sp. MTM3W5.2 TaxID=1805827 RepID=UPI00167932E1|nr:ABC transporter permease [Rhodococcus sp. MTM3W5.2]
MLAAEVVKLVSMRSTRWCGALIVVLACSWAVVWAGIHRRATDLSMPEFADNMRASVNNTQAGCIAGLVVVMIMAVLAATTEYRTGTIKLTFLTTPSRGKVVFAKTAAVALLAALIGEGTAWLAYGTAKLVNPSGVASITTGAQLRAVAGVGLVYMVGAATAVAVGMLIKNTVAAVALIVLYPLLIENVVSAIPGVGSAIEPWLPFTVALHFLFDSTPESLENAAILPGWWAFAYITTIATVLTATASIVITKRDA